jgi:cytochrome P450 family 6
MCTKDYPIPGTEVILEKGTEVAIPTEAIHHDPQYYDDPERFDPERFSEEAKSKRHHYVYLPFGEGPRICIGNNSTTLPTVRYTVNVFHLYRIFVIHSFI